MRRSPNDNSQIPRNGPNGPGQHAHGGGAHNMIMNKLHQCEIHMKATGRNRKNPLSTWLNKFPSRAKKIDVISRYNEQKKLKESYALKYFISQILEAFSNELFAILISGLYFRPFLLYSTCHIGVIIFFKKLKAKGP